MSVNREKVCYELLSAVIKDNAFSGIELDEKLVLIEDEKDRAYITKVFYGVLDKYVQFDYIISALCDKKPKVSVSILLKMGLYLQKYMSVPDYASVNKIVELAKSIGKGGAGGFINAVLRKVKSFDYDTLSALDKICFDASYPKWLVNLLKSEYGEQFAKSIMGGDCENLTHIRRCDKNIKKSEWESLYGNLSPDVYNLGYYVTHSTLASLKREHYTIQSLSSMLAVYAYAEGLSEKGKVLDLCSAPGGKAVFLNEIGNYDITACDIHPHRVELVKKYATRLGASINTSVADATVFDSKNEGAYDCVICDVPCSGIGVVGSKPDILLNRTFDDVIALTKIQKAILSIGARYVKVGGYINYSTCTVIKKENDNVVLEFLKENDNFILVPVKTKFFISDDSNFIRFFPSAQGLDGFFIAKMQRVR